MSWLGGEQVPGRFALAAGHHQPEGLEMSAIGDGESNNAGFPFAAMTSIPDQTMILGAFAFAVFAGFAQLFGFIQELVVLWPT